MVFFAMGQREMKKRLAATKRKKMFHLPWSSAKVPHPVLVENRIGEINSLCTSDENPTLPCARCFH
jgi:hypothetical protein